MGQRLGLTVNGQPYVLEVEPNELLLEVLRDRLGLTGTKECCSIGICGTCTVLLDGRRISSCLALAMACGGHEITTVEGLADEAGWDPVQQGFAEQGGFQCGYCTPGMILAARELLNRFPHPDEATIRHELEGNLCRCTGYYKIIRAVQRAAELEAAAPRRSDAPPQ